MLGMVVEQAKCDLVERGLGRADLCQHLDAVAVLLDHPSNTSNLPLDPGQALEELLLGGAVAAGGCMRIVRHRSPAYRGRVWGGVANLFIARRTRHGESSGSGPVH